MKARAVSDRNKTNVALPVRSGVRTPIRSHSEAQGDGASSGTVQTPSLPSGGCRTAAVPVPGAARQMPHNDNNTGRRGGRAVAVPPVVGDSASAAGGRAGGSFIQNNQGHRTAKLRLPVKDRKGGSASEACTSAMDQGSPSLSGAQPIIDLTSSPDEDVMATFAWSLSTVSAAEGKGAEGKGSPDSPAPNRSKKHAQSKSPPNPPSRFRARTVT